EGGEVREDEAGRWLRRRRGGAWSRRGDLRGRRAAAAGELREGQGAGAEEHVSATEEGLVHGGHPREVSVGRQPSTGPIRSRRASGGRCRPECSRGSPPRGIGQAIPTREGVP